MFRPLFTAPAALLLAFFSLSLLPAAAAPPMSAREKNEARRAGREMGMRPAEIEREIRDEVLRRREEGFGGWGNNWNNNGWNNNSNNNNYNNWNNSQQYVQPAQPVAPTPAKPKVQPNTALGEPKAASIAQIRMLTEELEGLLSDEFYAIDVILDGSRLTPVNMAALRVRVISDGHLERDFAALDDAVLKRDLDAIGTYGSRLRLRTNEIASLQIRAAARQLRGLVDDLAGTSEFQTVTRRLNRYLEQCAELTDPQKAALLERLDMMTLAVRIRETLVNPAVLASWPPTTAAWPGGGKVQVTTIFSESALAGQVLVLPLDYLLASSAQNPAWISKATPAEALTAGVPRVTADSAALAHSTAKSIVGESRVMISYPLPLEADPALGEQMSYRCEGREYELVPGGLNQHSRTAGGVIEFEAVAGAEPTKFGLEAGKRYGFTRDGDTWKFGAYTQHEYRLVIDNSESGMAFKYTVNGLETVVAPGSVAKWVLDAPMKIAYDADGGKTLRELQQAESGVYRLVKDNEGKVKLNNETTLRVALAAGDQWVLVDRAHWGSIAKSIPERVDPASLASIDPPGEPPSAAVAGSSTGGTEAGTGLSEPAPAAPTRPLFEETKPTLYVLAVGVSKYERSKYNLTYAHRDAEAFSELWKGSGAAQEKGVIREGSLAAVAPLYENVVTELLVNEEATKVNILKKLTWLERSVTSRDVAVIMFSGHGLVDEKSRFYLSTHEMDPDAVRATCVSQDDVRAVIEGLASRQTLLFFDACHSGQKLSGRKGAAKGVMDNFTKLGAGTVLFSSSLPEEVSLEDDRWQQGAFTRALVDAMADPATSDSNRDGYMSLAELAFQLESRVKELTGGRQHPAIDRPGTISGDFKVMRFTN